MSPRRAVLLLSVPAGLAATMVWLLVRGFDPGTPQEAPSDPGTPARYQLTGVDWTRYDDQGAPLMHAQAARARYFDDKTARLDQVRLDHLGGDGPWVLTAPSGLVPARERRVQLTAPVRIAGDLPRLGPVELEAVSLWVDPDRREIYTAERVTMDAPGRRASALGLRADWAGERVRLLNQVRVDYAQGRS